MKRLLYWLVLVFILLVSSSCLTARNTGDPIQSKVLTKVVKQAEIGKGQFLKCWSIALYSSIIMVGDYRRSSVHIFDWTKNKHLGQFGSNRDLTEFDKPWWEKVPANRFIANRLPKDFQQEVKQHITFRPASLYLKPDGDLVMGDDFVDLYLHSNDIDEPAIRIFEVGQDELTGQFHQGFIKDLYIKAGKPLSVAYNAYSDRYVMADEISNSVITMSNNGEDLKQTTEYRPPLPIGIITEYAKLVKTKEPVTNLDMIRNMGDGAGEFRIPISVATYRDQLYVADYGNNRIQIFNLQGKHLANLNGRDGIYTWFEKPRAVAVDNTGGIFVLTEKNIVIFSPRLECIGTFAQGDLIDPHQLVVYSTESFPAVLVTDSGVNAVLLFGVKEEPALIKKSITKSK